jgi:hypothetical protein
MLMVREMVVIIQKQHPNERVDTKIPRAVAYIQRGPRVVGVLQGTPIHGERRITGNPANHSQIQRQEDSYLDYRSQQYLQSYRHTRCIVHASEVCIGTRLLRYGRLLAT